MSLWVDEGLTIDFSHLPWHVVLGFGAPYSPHPPLYFVGVKLLANVAPDLIAGRLLSAAAGTLTIWVLYLLAARLATPRVGVAAAAALALSPLHIWYSQEARPYTLATLLVALSYLTLIRCYRDGQRRWLALYALCCIGALYTDVSAAFALAPQAALHLYMCRTMWRRTCTLLLTLSASAALYAPWLWQHDAILDTTSAQAQFALSAEKVADSVLSVTGLAANQSVFAGGIVPPWTQWPHLHNVMILAIALIAVLGSFGLLRRTRAAAIVAVALGAGTIGTASVMSLFYPSYAERTILPVILGWTLLVGALLGASHGATWLTVVGRVAALIALTFGLTTLAALDSDAYKQQWQLLARDAAVAARFGRPVVTYPSVAGTLVDLYTAGALGREHIALNDGANAAQIIGPRGSQRDTLWLAYIDGMDAQRLQSQLTADGYLRLVHLYYPHPLYLDLYTRSNAALGHVMALNGHFEEQNGRIAGWQLPPRGSTLIADGAFGHDLTIATPLAADAAARTAVAALPDHLYTLGLQARSQLRSGGVRAFLICVSARGAFLAVAPDGGGATVANDGRWHDMRLAALCPAGTDHLRIDLRNSGLGTASFRAAALSDAAPLDTSTPTNMSRPVTGTAR